MINSVLQKAREKSLIGLFFEFFSYISNVFDNLHFLILFSIKRRKVTRIISPGTIFEAAYLRPRQHNFLCCISHSYSSNGDDMYGICWLDISTGETKYSTSSEKELQSDLLRISPSEILLYGEMPDHVIQTTEPYCVTTIQTSIPSFVEITGDIRDLFSKMEKFSHMRLSSGDQHKKQKKEFLEEDTIVDSCSLADIEVTQLKDIVLSEQPIEEFIFIEHSSTNSTKPLDELESAFNDMNEVEKSAVMGVICYIRNSMPGQHSLSLYIPERNFLSVMKIDMCTKQSLEFLHCNTPDVKSFFCEPDAFSPDENKPRKKYHSLLSALDTTITAGAGRMLTLDLSAPLFSSIEINQRLDSVEYFIRRPTLVKNLRNMLRQISDIERCIQRVSLGRGSSRDMLSVGMSLIQIRAIQLELLSEFKNASTKTGEEYPHCIPSLLFNSVYMNIHSFPSLSDLLISAIVPNPPILGSVSGHIARGFSKKLDDMRDLSERGQSSISALLDLLKGTTSISSLKIMR